MHNKQKIEDWKKSGIFFQRMPRVLLFEWKKF